MHLTDTELRNWDKRRLRISREKRKSLLSQVSTLITKLESAIPAGSVFTVERFRRAGSLPKATALHPRGDTGIDADIGVYLNDANATDYDLATLHMTLRKIVAGVYPTKADEDFWVQPHTLGIQFRASGLKVDLVPLIAIADETEEAWMVDSTGRRSHKASIPGHLRFVRGEANADARFRPLTRMSKSWRNQNQLQDEIGSFAIELILAHLNRTEGAAPSLEAGIQRFLLYVAQTKLTEPILSGHATDLLPSGRVMILDPVNEKNNVGSRMTGADCDLIARTAETSWGTLVTAQHNSFKGDTTSLWREVFGSSFTTEAEEVPA